MFRERRRAARGHLPRRGAGGPAGAGPRAPRRRRALGPADPDRQHARAHRSARAHRAAPQDRRGGLRRGAEQGQRPARPTGRVDAARRPVQARRHAQPVREADHGGQGRPAHGSLRHGRRSWPPWAWPSATARSSSTTRSACRISPSTRCTFPRPRSGPSRTRPLPTTVFNGAGDRRQSAQDRGDRHQQVPLGPVPVVRGQGRGREARPEGRPLPRVRVRHAGLGRDGRPGQGRQARSSCGSARSASTATSSSRR